MSVRGEDSSIPNPTELDEEEGAAARGTHSIDPEVRDGNNEQDRGKVRRDEATRVAAMAAEDTTVMQACGPEGEGHELEMQAVKRTVAKKEEGGRR
jgi:hypothetical protein